MKNIDLEALRLNPRSYCNSELRTATVVSFATRSHVPCISLLLFMLDLVSATSFLWHFYLSSISHTYNPFLPLPLHTIYLMGSLLWHIFTRTDSYLPFF